MVGDWAERDIVGAAKFGMKTAFARYGDTFDTKTHNADYELQILAELIDIIIKENNYRGFLKQKIILITYKLLLKTIIYFSENV